MFGREDEEEALWPVSTPNSNSTSTSTSNSTSNSTSTSTSLVAPLDPDTLCYFPLAVRRAVTHNTVQLTFQLPTGVSLNLPTGQHIIVCAELAGEAVRRAYTPVSIGPGAFDLLVKVYPHGLISGYLAGLKVGDCVAVQGPKGRFVYERGRYREMALVAGGTGITPMLQVIKKVLSDPEDRTRLSLVYANVTEEDILLRGELDAYVACDDRLRVSYVLNNPPEGWTGKTGFVTEEVLRDCIPPPADDMFTLICGPPPMVKSVSLHLTTLGYPRGSVYKF